MDQQSRLGSPRTGTIVPAPSGGGMGQDSPVEPAANDEQTINLIYDNAARSLTRASRYSGLVNSILRHLWGSEFDQKSEEKTGSVEPEGQVPLIVSVQEEEAYITDCATQLLEVVASRLGAI